MSKSVSVKFPWESTQIVDTGVVLTPSSGISKEATASNHRIFGAAVYFWIDRPEYRMMNQKVSPNDEESSISAARTCDRNPPASHFARLVHTSEQMVAPSSRHFSIQHAVLISIDIDDIIYFRCYTFLKNIFWSTSGRFCLNHGSKVALEHVDIKNMSCELDSRQLVGEVGAEICAQIISAALRNVRAILKKSGTASLSSPLMIAKFVEISSLGRKSMFLPALIDVRNFCLP